MKHIKINAQLLEQGDVLNASLESIGDTLRISEQNELSISQEGFGDWIREKWRDWLQSMNEKNIIELQTSQAAIEYLLKLDKKTDEVIYKLKQSDKTDSGEVDLSSVAGFFLKDKKLPEDIVGAIKSSFRNVQTDASMAASMSKDGYNAVRTIYSRLDVQTDELFEKTFIEPSGALKKYHWTKYFKPGADNAKNYIGGAFVLVEKPQYEYDSKNGTAWFTAVSENFFSREGIPIPQVTAATLGKDPGHSRKFEKDTLLELGYFVKDMIKIMIDQYRTSFKEHIKMLDDIYDMQVEGYKYQAGSRDFGSRYANGLDKNYKFMLKNIQLPAILQKNSSLCAIRLIDVQFRATRNAFHLLTRTSYSF